MRFIHEEPGWPELSWDASALSADLASLRHKQGRLLGRMQALGFELRAGAHLEALTEEIVKSSAIENERLDPGEVRSSIARRLGLAEAGVRKRSREVEGVVELMLDATRNASATLSEERLFAWHVALFPTGRSGLRRIAVGAWRTRESGPMQVVSGPVSKPKVHFEAPEAQRVAQEMQRFLAWFNSPSVDDPVLRAGIAHLWFVTIHPFEDGNGRIARAIADALLARSDGADQRFYSMSAQIEAERRDYYAELEATQRGGLDVTRWLAWFFGCLARALDASERTLDAVFRKARAWERANAHPLNSRQRAVIGRLLGDFEGHLTVSKYAKIAKCSTDSALRDIRALLEWRMLERNEAGGRSTSYRLAAIDARSE